MLSKLYTSHLKGKLNEWVEYNKILRETEAGCSTLVHCVVLNYLIAKYSTNNTSSLNTAFIDYKTFFSMVHQNLLWEKLMGKN